MATQFYSVKTFYRCIAQGRPEKPDRYFDPDATLVEERIQLFKAKNKSEALKKAEKDAIEYASRIQYKNPYNQEVKLEYIGLNEVYEIEHALTDKTEIFAASRVLSKKVSVSKIAHVYLSKRESHKTSKRKKFINREYFNE